MDHRSSDIASTDAALGAAWARGDARAVAAVYDRYAGPLYAFALSRTRRAADAADVVQDTFVRAASGIAQLRDPSRLRPWLYAIARRRVYDLSRKQAAVNDDATIEALAATTEDPGSSIARDEVRDLVWQAAESLNDRDRDLLVLHLRHGLEGADLADAVGVSPAHVYSLVNRLKERMAKAVGALLVARHGRADCDRLAELLRGWDGRFTLDVRSRVTRHVESCETCDERRSVLVVPANFAAGSMAITLVAPAALRDRTLAAVDLARVNPSSRVADRRGWRPDGFPQAAGRAARRAAALVGSMVASVLFVGVAVIATRDDRVAEPSAVAPITSTDRDAPDAGVADTDVAPAAPADVTDPPAPIASAPSVTSPSTTGEEPNDGASDGELDVDEDKDGAGGPVERDDVAPVPVPAPTAVSTTPSTTPSTAPGATSPATGTAPGGAGGTATTRPPTVSPSTVPSTVSPATTAAPATTPTTATTTPPPTTVAPPPPPPANLSVSGGNIDLGATTASGSFTVTNSGGQPATLSTSTTSSAFSVSNATATVAPGTSVSLTVTVNRSVLAEGSHSAQVSVSAPGASGGGGVTVVARVERAPVLTNLTRTPSVLRTSTSCGQTLTTVSVQLSDESGIDSASVLWSSDGSFAQRTDLTLQSTGRWTAQIGSFSKVGANNLRVDVTDTRGNAASATVSVSVVAC